MNRTLDSSLVIRWIREIHAAVGALGRPLQPLITVSRSGMSWFSGAEHRPSVSPFPKCARVAQENRILSAIDRGVGLGCVAAQHSQTTRIMAPCYDRARSLEPWQRVRLLGWTLIVAALSHRVILRLGTEPGRVPATVVGYSAMAVGLALMSWCRTIASAWIERTLQPVDTFRRTGEPSRWLRGHGPTAYRGTASPTTYQETSSMGSRPAIIGSRLIRVVIVVALFVGVGALVVVARQAMRVTGQWSTATKTITVPGTVVFVWTINSGFLAGTGGDRPTRFSVSPVEGARIVSITGERALRSEQYTVNAATGAARTDARGSVTVVVRMAIAGSASVTATDVMSGVSVTATFIGR